MKFPTLCIVLLLAGVLPMSAAGDVSISVPNIDAEAENVVLTSIGASTALNIGYANYVVGPAGTFGPEPIWARPIVQFPVSSFSSIAGMSVDYATISYSIVSDFLELGETAVSGVRLFTTNETVLNLTNRDVFAGLSGDGGAHTTAALAPWAYGVTGAQSLVVSPAGRTALYNAINGPDTTIVVAFREFAVSGGGGDLLDEIVLGAPPGNITIDIIATPEPATLSLMGVGALAVLRRRRKK
jgi:hypothetical protein